MSWMDVDNLSIELRDNSYDILDQLDTTGQIVLPRALRPSLIGWHGRPAKP